MEIYSFADTIYYFVKNYDNNITKKKKQELFISSICGRFNIVWFICNSKILIQTILFNVIITQLLLLFQNKDLVLKSSCHHSWCWSWTSNSQYFKIKSYKNSLNSGKIECAREKKIIPVSCTFENILSETTTADRISANKCHQKRHYIFSSANKIPCLSPIIEIL